MSLCTNCKDTIEESDIIPRALELGMEWSEGGNDGLVSLPGSETDTGSGDVKR